MKRSVLCVLSLAVLAAGCRTAGPRVVPTGSETPPALRPYVGQLRLVRHDLARPARRIAPRQPAAVACTVAVRVRAASIEQDAARFSLETVGVPRLRERRAECRRLQPELDLLIAGVAGSADPAELTARIDAVLQTSEGYLQSNGVAFERDPAELPAAVASREVLATSEEHSLGRQVTAWPLPLLSVDPWYHDRSGRVRHEGEVEMDAVVGSDGRLYRPRVKTGLSDVHESAVLGPLPLWRFEPARRGEVTVPARIALHPVLHIY